LKKAYRGSAHKGYNYVVINPFTLHSLKLITTALIDLIKNDNSIKPHIFLTASECYYIINSRFIKISCYFRSLAELNAIKKNISPYAERNMISVTKKKRKKKRKGREDICPTRSSLPAEE